LIAIVLLLTSFTSVFAEDFGAYTSNSHPMPNFNTLFPTLGAGQFGSWRTFDWTSARMANGVSGTNFPTIGATAAARWQFNAGEVIAETGANPENNFFRWSIDNQSGGRSAASTLPSPAVGNRVFVTFDFLPGTTTAGNNPNRPALALEFRSGTGTLLGITQGRTNAGALQFGAISGATMPVDTSNPLQRAIDSGNFTRLSNAGANIDALTNPAWTARWYTFGIMFDFGTQQARIMAVERGTSTLRANITVPISGTDINQIALNYTRPSGVGITTNNNGLDNLFFFYETHQSNTIVEFIAPASLGRPPSPSNSSSAATLWQNWFIRANRGASLASLGLPTHIDAILFDGSTARVPINWHVTNMPWTRTADRPSNMVFNSNISGVFEFTGTSVDVQGVAHNRMGVSPQIFVEVREGLLHSHARPVEWLNRGVVAVPVNLTGARGGNLVQWRLSADEYQNPPMQFNVYRVRGNSDTRITATSATNFRDTSGLAGDIYWVVPVGATRNCVTAGRGIALTNNFLQIPVQRPRSRPNPALAFNGTLNYPSTADPVTTIDYLMNEMSVADVDGDGQYEILVKWTTNMQRDPGLSARHTGEMIYDLYKFCPINATSELLWRINWGINRTAGEHTAVMHFFDLDNSGFANFAAASSEGTRVYHPDPLTGQVSETFEGGTPVYIIGGNGTNNHRGNFNYHALLNFSRGFYTRGTTAVGGNWVSNPRNVWIGGTRCPVRNVNNTGAVGRINNGPEFFTVFDGRTGIPIDSIEYFAPYGIQRGGWGDNNQNRSDRWVGAVAFMPKGGIDGAEPWPTMIEARQHYNPSFVGAYQLIDGKLRLIWTYDYRQWGRPTGGNHQMTVGDVTFSGYDDINFGSVVLNHRGHILWAATGDRGTINVGHGDALHQTPIFPNSSEFYRFSPHEAGIPNNVTLFHAATGRPVWTHDTATSDVGRGTMGNITPLPGFEVWASGGTPIHNIATGERIHVGGSAPGVPINFMVYWTGALTREFLDGGNGNALTISRLGGFNFSYVSGVGIRSATGGTRPAQLQATRSDVQTLTGTASVNGTKANPSLQADILGDWRENIIVRTSDNRAIRIYITNHHTPYTMYTFMHDPAYRAAVSWQNAIYNQPPHLSFYLGPTVHDQVIARNLPVPNTRFTRQPAPSVHFRAVNGASFINSADSLRELTQGENAGELPRMQSMSNPNFRFVGWFDENGTERRDNFVPQQLSTTLTARWEPTPANFRIGDVDGDGIRTSLDLTNIARYAAGHSVNICRLSADLNGDGHISLADVTLLARWLIGYDLGDLIAH
jgi:hypothetical protein